MVLDAVAQVWPAFVLVAGLLLIGQAVAADGLFEAAGMRIAIAPLSPRALLVALLCLVAVATAVLNLDTAVIFLTPVLLHAARQRSLDERPFLYGAVFMSNSASLLLPGSNLTNLLVLHNSSRAEAEFAIQMLPAWLTACAVTAAFLMVAFPLQANGPGRAHVPPPRFSPKAIALVTVGAVVMVAAPNPALPMLTLGIAAITHYRLRPRLDLRLLAALFTAAVVLGTLGRAWPEPVQAVSTLGGWPTACIAALTSILLNNLPATMLLSAHATPHPSALLVGLDLGPNLAVTGSLSAFLWMRSAAAVGAHPSIRTYSLLGLALVPVTIAGSLAVSAAA